MLQAPIELEVAHPNHAIWNAKAKAMCFFPAECLWLVMGEPMLDGFPTLWCVRDTLTGAHLKVWRSGGMMEQSHWFVTWIDGPRQPGSGRHVAEHVCGEDARGRLELIDD